MVRRLLVVAQQCCEVCPRRLSVVFAGHDVRGERGGERRCRPGPRQVQAQLLSQAVAAGTRQRRVYLLEKLDHALELRAGTERHFRVEVRHQRSSQGLRWWCFTAPSPRVTPATQTRPACRRHPCVPACSAPLLQRGRGRHRTARAATGTRSRSHHKPPATAPKSTAEPVSFGCNLYQVQRVSARQVRAMARQPNALTAHQIARPAAPIGPNASPSAATEIK